MRNVCQPLRDRYPTLESMERQGNRLFYRSLRSTAQSKFLGFLLSHEVELLNRVIEHDGEEKLPLTVANWYVEYRQMNGRC